MPCRLRGEGVDCMVELTVSETGVEEAGAARLSNRGPRA